MGNIIEHYQLVNNFKLFKSKIAFKRQWTSKKYKKLLFLPSGGNPYKSCYDVTVLSLHQWPTQVYIKSPP